MSWVLLLYILPCYNRRSGLNMYHPIPWYRMDSDWHAMSPVHCEVFTRMHGVLDIPQFSPALLPSTVPSAPENVTLTITPASRLLSQLLVRWTIDPSSELISNYTVYVTRLDVGNATLTYTSTNTQFNIPSNDLDPSDLDAGELVLVHVSASNSAGEGARSPGVRGRTREERKTSQQECDPSYNNV